MEPAQRRHKLRVSFYLQLQIFGQRHLKIPRLWFCYCIKADPKFYKIATAFQKHKSMKRRFCPLWNSPMQVYKFLNQ